MKFLISALIILTFLFPVKVLANSPSPQQIEQFKKLPKAQREALAKKYGIDLSALDKKKKGQNEQNAEQEPTVLPRDEELEELLELEDKYRPKEDEIKPFGYELFAGEPTTFMPTEIAAIPDSYLVGIGDMVKVNFFGKTNEEHEIEIDREGRLAIPTLSPVYVAGLSFIELKALVKEKVASEMIGVKAFVTMGRLNSMRVMVVGEAYKPGSYSVSPMASVTHALFVAGGISDKGSLRNIQVKRAGKLVTTFDLYDLLLEGDSSSDVVLKSGDVVFIPPAEKRITVKGEVNRQAIFELTENDTAADVVAMSGGFKANANKSRVAVARFNGDGRKVTLNVNFNNQDAYVPTNGDELTVGVSSSRLNDTVTIIGAVNNPGHYQWYQGKTLADIFQAPKDDLLPIADYEYGLIVRETNFLGDIEILQFSLADTFNNKVEPLVLNSNDTIVVFSRYQLKSEEAEGLKNLAYTEQQLQYKENVKLWETYEKSQYLKFIGVEDEFTIEEEELEVITSIDALFEKDEEIDDEDYAVFSRYKLLTPIINKLQQQATIDKPTQIFAINGEVNFPGVYPLPIAASYHDAVNAAGGYLESAFLEKVELTRVKYEGEKLVKHTEFNALTDESLAQLTLISKDTVNIFPKPNWHDRLEVKVVGEVLFPGTYSIKRGETLESLLKRAGGLSQFAHQEAAIFTRESIKKKEQSQIQRLTEDLRRDIITNSFQKESVTSRGTSASLSYEDMDQILTDLSKVEALGRLVIDLDKNSSQELQLEHGDALYIPAMQDSVSVIGEVNLASTHIYNSTMSAEDYITASGGLKKKADDERIYIIKANGSVQLPDSSHSWFAVGDTGSQIEPGDTIVVPLDSQKIDSLTMWSTASQILYQLGLAAASISTLKD